MARPLAIDYYIRSGMRLKALDTLLNLGAYPDVVREAQELSELLLKGMLRGCGIDPPKVHDVGPSLVQYARLLPNDVQSSLQEVVAISRFLRKEREISFYGDDDLIPLNSYTQDDANDAIKKCTWLFELLTPFFESLQRI
jgi:HEPN domain-containing protein